jgi:hypothetical protein
MCVAIASSENIFLVASGEHSSWSQLLNLSPLCCPSRWRTSTGLQVVAKNEIQMNYHIRRAEMQMGREFRKKS